MDKKINMLCKDKVIREYYYKFEIKKILKNGENL